jgi:hypothetical protein
LPSAGGFVERFFRTLGKKGFAECQIKNTRQSLCTRQRRICRVSNKKHSAKEVYLPSVKKTLGKGFFAECQIKTLGKAIFQTMFWCPKRL